MAKWRRPAAELVDALSIQRKALRSSADAYDRGAKWEALRLATAVHVLVFDGRRNTKSILTQLGQREELQFHSTPLVNMPSGSMVPQHPLVFVEATANGSIYRPICDWDAIPRSRVPFQTWWGGEDVFRDGHYTVSRRQLVTTLRDKDGGSHVDESLDDDGYLRMSRPSPTTARFKLPGEPPKLILGMELAAMRQVAWEVEETLRDLPDDLLG